MVISGEDVAQEFKSSGLFDSHLSDIWQEVNQTGSSFLTREQFILACLLVYEHANNMTVEKEAALVEYL